MLFGNHVLSCTPWLSRYDPEVCAHYPPDFFDLVGPAGRSPWPSGGFWENHQTMGDFPAMFSARVDGMINQLGINLLEEVIADVLFSFYCYSTLYICSSSGSMYYVDHCLVLLFKLSCFFVVNSWLIIHVYIVMLYHVQ